MRRRTLLGMLLGGATLPALADMHASVYRSSLPTPRGRIFTPIPELTWPAFPNGERQVSRVRLSIGTRELDARFDPERGVIGRPSTPLPPGEHEALAEVRFNDGWKASIRWQFTVLPAPPPAPTPPTAAREMLTRANEVRRKASLPPMTLDARLCWAAQRHSEWQRKNNVFGHYQDAGSPGFFGADAQDRAGVCGFSEGVYEGIHSGPSTPQEAISQLFYAPYHRMAFLQPGSVAFGGGTSGELTTALCEATKRTEIVTWPATGQKNLPLSWQGDEIPNPLRLHPVKSGQPVGTILSFSYFCPEQESIAVTSAAIWTPDGEVVPLFLNTPQNDEHLQNTVFVIPQKPLKPGTTYTASVLARVVRTGEPLQRQWSFTTAAK